MKNMSKKGFTLVELIVVITILAILGTIAFLNFGQYTQDAKDSKVVTDLQNISKKTATVVAANNSIYLKDVLSGTGLTANILTSGTFNSGVTLTGWINYNAGNINFKNLGEDGSKFRDNDDNEYVFAYAVDGAKTFYQVAGNTKDAAGNAIAKVEGYYYKGISTDTDSLIKDYNHATAAVTNNSTVNLPYASN